MNHEPKTYYLQSKTSNQKLVITIPTCVLYDIYELPGKHQDKSAVYGIKMNVKHLAFSSPKFPNQLECRNKQDEQYGVGFADIYALNPFSEEEKQLLKSNPFEYLIYFRKSVGATYLDNKNHMDLYKVSPVQDGIFVKKDFPGISRPLLIKFIRFNGEESDKNNSFRYAFSIDSTLKGGYNLNYEVYATPKDPSQFAEKLRNIIEDGKNVLDYPEVIAGFVENNERIADYFEGKMHNTQ